MEHNQIIVLEAPWNRLHREIQELQIDAKNKAAEIGKMLIAKKASPEIKHGAWKQWIEDNCEFSYNSAQEYMRVARRKNTERRLFDQCTSIREVLALGKPKKKPEAKPKLDNDDRRKINKLRKIVDDPATPPAMKNAAEIGGTKVTSMVIVKPLWRATIGMALSLELV